MFYLAFFVLHSYPPFVAIYTLVTLLLITSFPSLDIYFVRKNDVCNIVCLEVGTAPTL